jgi:hypothetical protein
LYSIWWISSPWLSTSTAMSTNSYTRAGQRRDQVTTRASTYLVQLADRLRELDDVVVSLLNVGQPVARDGVLVALQHLGLEHLRRTAPGSAQKHSGHTRAAHLDALAVVGDGSLQLLLVRIGVDWRRQHQHPRKTHMYPHALILICRITAFLQSSRYSFCISWNSAICS